MNTTTIKHRLVVPIQTRGNIGKSTEAIVRCEWMNQRDVSWQGFDLDVSNRTLSKTYPDNVNLVPESPEPVGDLIRILKRIRKADVTVLDPSAHMNKLILKAFGMMKFPKTAAEAEARATVLVFPIDEISDMEDIATTVDALKDNVDWVVVRNPFKMPVTKFFDGSELERELIDYGAAFLELPSLLSDTRNHLRALEVDADRGISPAEALLSDSLKVELVHRLILEEWMRDVFERLDAIAGHLLPTDRAATLAKPEPKAEDPVARNLSRGINLGNLD